MRRWTTMLAFGFLVFASCTNERPRPGAPAGSAGPPVVAEAVTPSAAPDPQITRFTSLVGKTKEQVVQALGPPTEFEYLTGIFTYKADDRLVMMKFFDPEREQSMFNSQTRGGAAALAALIVRFEWKPSVAAVLRSVDAADRPAYMRVGREEIAWYLHNLPANNSFAVAFGGVQKQGFAYEIFASCTTPPLTGKSTFNYATNRQEIATLAPNPAFLWTACTPREVRMSARKDWKDYGLWSYDPKDLDDRVSLDGSPLPPEPEVAMERVGFDGLRDPGGIFSDPPTLDWIFRDLEKAQADKYSGAGIVGIVSAVRRGDTLVVRWLTGTDNPNAMATAYSHENGRWERDGEVRETGGAPTTPIFWGMYTAEELASKLRPSNAVSAEIVLDDVTACSDGVFRVQWHGTMTLAWSGPKAFSGQESLFRRAPGTAPTICIPLPAEAQPAALQTQLAAYAEAEAARKAAEAARTAEATDAKNTAFELAARRDVQTHGAKGIDSFESRGGGGVGASDVRSMRIGAAHYMLRATVQQPRYAVAGREWAYPVRVTADGGFLSGTDHQWEFSVPSFETIRNVIDASLNSHPMAAQIREDSIQVEERAYSESTKLTTVTFVAQIDEGHTVVRARKTVFFSPENGTTWGWKLTEIAPPPSSNTMLVNGKYTFERLK